MRHLEGKVNPGRLETGSGSNTARVSRTASRGKTGENAVWLAVLAARASGSGGGQHLEIDRLHQVFHTHAVLV
ncbi:MAG: hypothetical protein ACKOJF_21160, partial [Planctomycetaceae bacterium]